MAATKCAITKLECTQSEAIQKSLDNTANILQLLRGKENDRNDLGMAGALQAMLDAGLRRDTAIELVTIAVKEVRHALDSEVPPGYVARLKTNETLIASHAADLLELKTATSKAEAAAGAAALVAKEARSVAEALVTKAAEEALAVKAKAVEEADAVKAKADEEAKRPRPLFFVKDGAAVFFGKWSLNLAFAIALIIALAKVWPRFNDFIEAMKGVNP